MALRFVVPALALGLALLTTRSLAADLLGQPVKPVHGPESQFSLVVAPYGWAAGLTGTVGVGALPPVDVDQSFADIFDDLNFAAFVSAELAYRRFIGFTDLQYANLSASAPTPFGIVADRVKLRTETVSWILAGGYRVIDNDRGDLAALAGGRLWSVSNRIGLTNSRIDDNGFEKTETWVDPIVGLKGRVDVLPAVSLVGWGFIGGFGAASDLTWDVLGGVGWSPRESVSIYLGYRAQAVDYSTSGFEYDVIQHGPLIGGAIRF